MNFLTVTTDDVVAAHRRHEADLVAQQMIRLVMPNKPTPEDFEQAESQLLQLPQIACPLEHRFAPGIYMREIEMPAGTFIIGGEHKTEHFNVVLTGRAYVMIDGVIQEIVAPCTFVSKPGVRKVLYIVETMRWQTIHSNPEDVRDIDVLENILVTRTQTDIEHRRRLKQSGELQTYINHESSPA